MDNNQLVQLTNVLGRTQAEPRPDMHYGLEIETDEGTEKLYPMPTKDAVRKAASHIEANKSKLPFSWRKRLASNILKRAEELSVTLGNENYLYKAAGKAFPDPEETSVQLLVRASQVTEPELKQSMEKLACDVSEGKLRKSAYPEIAEFISEVDQAYNLHTKYSKELPSPEESVFGITPNKAAELLGQMTELPGKRYVLDEQLQETPIRKAATAIGGEFEECINGMLVFDLAEVKSAATGLEEKDVETLLTLLPEA